MTKQVLVISGSPRPRGNTYKICRLLEARLRELGDVSFHYVSLSKLNLQTCCGCLACMRRGEKACPRKDNAMALRDEMLAADAIVFLSPVYVHTVTALMKNFYDRFAYLCHQPRFHDKAALLIATTELTGAKEAFEQMRFVAFAWGFRIAGELGVVYPSFVKEGPYRERMLKAIDGSAHRLWEALTEPRPSPSIKELAFFYALQTKVRLHKDVLPQDYAFWQERGWFDRPYFRDVAISPIKLAIARALVWIKVRQMRRELGLELPQANVRATALGPAIQ